jgi:hypothetical protein
MMASQHFRMMMDNEVGIAMAAARYPAASVADQGGGESSAVKE